ncbi:MAG: nucleotidyl transferase AbiEii/AbiGii toxin family protein [Candidatus Edwardsbacteria bacterium]
MLSSKGIMTKLQLDLLLAFSNLPDGEAFYLTGGTALSEFYLAHRKSFDLDLFTIEKGLILPFSRVLEGEIRKEFSLNTIRRFETLAEFEISKRGEKTKIQLAYDSPFRFEEPIDSNIGVKVNDYKDLTVDKLLAFFGRAEPRDVVDLFFILKTENFWELTQLASKKDPGFDLYWLAIALEKTKKFPDDINKWPVEMIKEVKVEELKNLYSILSKKVMDKIKLKNI